MLWAQRHAIVHIIRKGNAKEWEFDACRRCFSTQAFKKTTTTLRSVEDIIQVFHDESDVVVACYVLWIANHWNHVGGAFIVVKERHSRNVFAWRSRAAAKSEDAGGKGDRPRRNMIGTRCMTGTRLDARAWGAIARRGIGSKKMVT